MFYEKLKENRIQLGLSEEQLSNKLNVSKETIAKWETGVSMPDLKNVIKLSDIFNVSTDYLLKDRKSDSDFSYYTVVQEEKKTLSPYKLLSILGFAISLMAIITLFVVTIVEPLTHINEAGKEIKGFFAYCYIYTEFSVVIIFLFIVLILALLVILIPDKKLQKVFRKKI
jgi:transcriptional regulator with XRE-family HTH domain